MVEFKLVPFEETTEPTTDFKLVPLEKTEPVKELEPEFNLVPLREEEPETVKTGFFGTGKEFPVIADKGLEPKEDPGFLNTLKNPIELWRYNSLPVAAYQMASGETKAKQAQESLDWLESNPGITSGKDYAYHRDMYNRYGFALSTEPFSLEAVAKTLTSQPKVFAGELVNALVADPYLMIPWFWGGWAAKAAQTTQIGAKMMATAPKFTKGITTAAATLPTLTTYSTVQQLSESGELDIDRIQGEVMLGGAAAFLIGTIGAGASSKSSRILGLTHEDLTVRY